METTEQRPSEQMGTWRETLWDVTREIEVFRGDRKHDLGSDADFALVKAHDKITAAMTWLSGARSDQEQHEESKR